MKFLKNRRAWQHWKRTAMGGQDGVVEPTSYPCFGYTSVGSFGSEEYRENYLYPADIERMQKELSHDDHQ